MIEIKVVENYDEGRFKQLIKENLENMGTFVPDWEYRTKGDATYKCENRKLRVGAFDGDKLIGLSFGEAKGTTRFCMNMSLVEPEYRGQGLYSRMLDKVLEETKIYDEIDSYHQVFKLIRSINRQFHN